MSAKFGELKPIPPASPPDSPANRPLKSGSPPGPWLYGEPPVPGAAVDAAACNNDESHCHQ